jgi:hypothetical protein
MKKRDREAVRSKGRTILVGLVCRIGRLWMIKIERSNGQIVFVIIQQFAISKKKDFGVVICFLRTIKNW